MIKPDKWIDTTDLFNKQVMLELRNLSLFNKCVGLVLTHIVEYSLVDDTNPTHKHELSPLVLGALSDWFLVDRKGFGP